jgi:hypothetical protein
MRLVVVCLAKDVQVSADTAKVSVTHPTECASGAIANVAGGKDACLDQHSHLSVLLVLVLLPSRIFLLWIDRHVLAFCQTNENHKPLFSITVEATEWERTPQHANTLSIRDSVLEKD